MQYCNHKRAKSRWVMKDTQFRHVQWELIGGGRKNFILSHFNYLLGLPIMARISEMLNTPNFSFDF
jgi:hypothetical protein